jgi:hypothetical protein
MRRWSQIERWHRNWKVAPTPKVRYCEYAITCDHDFFDIHVEQVHRYMWSQKTRCVHVVVELGEPWQDDHKLKGGTENWKVAPTRKVRFCRFAVTCDHDFFNNLVEQVHRYMWSQTSRYVCVVPLPGDHFPKLKGGTEIERWHRNWKVAPRKIERWHQNPKITSEVLTQYAWPT